jgi:hypothetical protein
MVPLDHQAQVRVAGGHLGGEQLLNVVESRVVEQHTHQHRQERRAERNRNG